MRFTFLSNSAFTLHGPIAVCSVCALFKWESGPSLRPRIGPRLGPSHQQFHKQIDTLFQEHGREGRNLIGCLSQIDYLKITCANSWTFTLTLLVIIPSPSVSPRGDNFHLQGYKLSPSLSFTLPLSVCILLTQSTRTDGHHRDAFTQHPADPNTLQTHSCIWWWYKNKTTRVGTSYPYQKNRLN